jgi:hypothetical protein
MAAYDHVILLLSFVFALALTHLLSRIAALIVSRERVRFSGLLTLAMLNAVALVYTNWLQLWDIRGMRQWDLFSITALFAFAVTIYFVCALAAPEFSAEGEIDMEAFYWRNRRPFYTLLLLCMTLAIVSNFAFLQTPNTALFFQENAATLPFFVPCVLALAVPARWAQWLAGIGLLALTSTFAIVFSDTLH